MEVINSQSGNIHFEFRFSPNFALYTMYIIQCVVHTTCVCHICVYTATTSKLNNSRSFLDCRLILSYSLSMISMSDL